jgi:hypothetical protein
MQDAYRFTPTRRTMSHISGSTLQAPAIEAGSLDEGTYSRRTEANAVSACLNCGAAITDAYCSSCGQGRVDRITLSAFAHELAGQFLEIDRGLLRTFVDLLRRPGATIRGYINGRRRSYTSPLAYILIASAFSVLRAALTPETAQKLADMNSSIKPTLALLYSPAQIDVIMGIESLITTNKFAMDAYLLVPLVLSMRLLFRKRNVNVAELAVFTCFTFGQATFVTILVGLPLLFFQAPTLYSGIFMAVTLGYLVYAGIGFFGRGAGTVLRLAASVLLGLVLMNVLTYTLPFILAR